MRSSPRKAIAITVLLLEAGVVLYFALVVWLFAVWMIDDSVAFRLGSVDWYIEAAQRGAVSLLCALAVALSSYVANRRWLPRMLPSNPVLPRRVALGFGLVVAIAGLAGAVQFAVTRPFM